MQSVAPAEVRAGPDRIEWRITAGSWIDGAPALDCLWAFVALATDARPANVAAFARRFGVLGLLPNGLPGLAADAPPPAAAGDADWHWESTAGWDLWARHAKAVLLLAAALRANARVDAQALLAEAGLRSPTEARPTRPPLVATTPDGGETLTELGRRALTTLSVNRLAANLDGQPTLALQRTNLAYQVGMIWLADAALTPIIAWDDQPARISLAVRDGRGGWGGQGVPWWPARSLFGVLAAAIASVLGSDDQVSQCQRCGTPYPTRRKARHDQPHYCDACRVAVRRATNRRSAERRRAHQRAARG